MDPTSRGDMEAAIIREWYERNRETWWNRIWPFGAGPDRTGLHADEFMLRFIGEVHRVRALADVDLYLECA
jgi:hypothetical protein